MRVTSAVIAATLVVSAIAQSNTITASSTSTSSASANSKTASATSSNAPAIHTINVGKGGNNYDPQTVKAAVGDIITFVFFPANHSVIRADYGYPCIPYEDLHPTGNIKGFFSGFQPIATIGDVMPTWNLTINDTAPVFFYCSAPDACMKDGMVGAINPNATQTVQVQANEAKQADYQLNPGEPFPAEASSSISSIAATATATSTVTSTPTSSPSPAAASHHSLSGGAIAGIAIGALAALALAGALFYFIGRTRTLKENLDDERRQSRQHPVMTEQMYPPSTGPGSDVTAPPYAPSSYYKDTEVGSVRSSSPPVTQQFGSMPTPPAQQGHWGYGEGQKRGGHFSAELPGVAGYGHGHTNSTGQGLGLHELDTRRS